MQDFNLGAMLAAVVAAIPSDSLLARHAVGGLDAWGGFDRQARFILQQIPLWLGDPDFVAFTPERAEDVDVEFRSPGGRQYDHYQIKTETLTPASIRGLVRVFQHRYAANLAEHLVRRFIIVSDRLSDAVRSAAIALSRFTATHFVPGEASTTEASTRADMDRQLEVAGLAEVERELRTWVSIPTDVDGLGSIDAAVAIAASRASRLELFRTDTSGCLEEVVTVLYQRVVDRKRCRWTRDLLAKELEQIRDLVLAGPPTTVGDIVSVCHETLAPVTREPDEDLLLRIGTGRRRLPLRLSTLSVRTASSDAIRSAVADIAGAASEFRRLLAKMPAPEIVYYGFAHVPLAVLAGWTAGEQRHVHLAEHDRETGRFAWPAAPMRCSVHSSVRPGAGHAVRLRVSVSAPVAEDLCVQPTDTPDIHVYTDPLGSGCVHEESIARQIAREVRKVLSNHVAGNAAFREIHLFAAVPMSVAFLLGQVLSASALPRTIAYNYVGGSERRYTWALCLQEAASSSAALRIIDERG